MKHEILLLPDVAERLKLSTASINRLLARRRRGEDELFPLPISNSHAKAKGRWLASDVDDYIESLSNVKATPLVLPKRKQKRERQRREELAKALERHGIKCKAKEPKES